MKIRSAVGVSILSICLTLLGVGSAFAASPNTSVTNRQESANASWTYTNAAGNIVIVDILQTSTGVEDAGKVRSTESAKPDVSVRLNVLETTQWGRLVSSSSLVGAPTSRLTSELTPFTFEGAMVGQRVTYTENGIEVQPTTAQVSVKLTPSGQIDITRESWGETDSSGAGYTVTSVHKTRPAKACGIIAIDDVYVVTSPEMDSLGWLSSREWTTRP